MTPPSSGTRIRGLDGLRGLAVGLVLLYHFAPRDLVRTGAVARGIVQAAAAGWCGVDLFFVLSGFLITGILLDAKGEEGYFRTFYVRRTLRIFPLYYGVLAVVFVVLPLIPGAPDARRLGSDQISLWLYGTNFTIVARGDWVYHVPRIELNHFWSLAIEEQFYLLWPLVVFATSRRGLARVSALLIALAIVSRTALVFAGAPPTSTLLLTPCRLDGLAMGALLSIALRQADLVPIARRMAVAGLWAGGALLLAEIVLRRGLLSDTPEMQAIGHSVLCAFFACLLVRAVLVPPRFLTSAAMCTLGTYSYGIYVFHLLLRGLFERWFPPASLARALGSPLAGAAAFVVLASVATFAVAVASRHLYESPFLRLRARFGRRASGAGSEVARPAA